MSNMITGYTGLFKPPFEELNKYGISNYAITGDCKDKIILFMRSPHFFNDLYNVTTIPGYSHIFLVPPKMDEIFYSDTYLLYKEITKNLLKKCTIVTEKKLQTDLFYNDNLSGSVVSIPMQTMGGTVNVSIDYVYNEINLCNCGPDMIVSDGERKIYFPTCITERVLDNLVQKYEGIDEIHVSYSDPLYGGFNYPDIVRNYPMLKGKLRIGTFKTLEEYKWCASHHMQIGRQCYNDFV